MKIILGMLIHSGFNRTCTITKCTRVHGDVVFHCGGGGRTCKFVSLAGPDSGRGESRISRVYYK